MHPVLLSLLLGSTAAAANVFGGTIIVKRNWDRSYLKYFVALGAGFMLASGRSRRLAWSASVLLGAATFAGVLTMAVFQRHVGIGLPLSGGVTIYVAASDLMPEVNREPGGKMALVVLLGVGIFFLLDRLVR